jgi:hypothetical protein
MRLDERPAIAAGIALTVAYLLTDIEIAEFSSAFGFAL